MNPSPGRGLGEERRGQQGEIRGAASSKDREILAKQQKGKMGVRRVETASLGPIGKKAA